MSGPWVAGCGSSGHTDAFSSHKLSCPTGWHTCLCPSAGRRAGEVRCPRQASRPRPELEGTRGSSGPGHIRSPHPTGAGQGRRHREPTWSPMTHWPAFMVASSKLRSCFSEYLTPMSTPLCSPFVLAWRGGVLGASKRWGAAEPLAPGPDCATLGEARGRAPTRPHPAPQPPAV